MQSKNGIIFYVAAHGLGNFMPEIINEANNYARCQNSICCCVTTEMKIRQVFQECISGLTPMANKVFCIKVSKNKRGKGGQEEPSKYKFTFNECAYYTEALKNFLLNRR